MFMNALSLSKEAYIAPAKNWKGQNATYFLIAEV